MKPQDLSKKKHDMKGAVSSLYGLVEAIQMGDFDFSSTDGKDLIAQAEAAQTLLLKEIEFLFDKLDLVNQK